MAETARVEAEIAEKKKADEAETADRAKIDSEMAEKARVEAEIAEKKKFDEAEVAEKAKID